MTTVGDSFRDECSEYIDYIKISATQHVAKYDIGLEELGAFANSIDDLVNEFVEKLDDAERRKLREERQTNAEWEQIRKQEIAQYLHDVGMPR